MTGGGDGCGAREDPQGSLRTSRGRGGVRATGIHVWETGLRSPRGSGWPGGRPVRCGFICIGGRRCGSSALGRCQNCGLAICERHMALTSEGPHARVLCITCVLRGQARDRGWNPDHDQQPAGGCLVLPTLLPWRHLGEAVKVIRSEAVDLYATEFDAPMRSWVARPHLHRRECGPSRGHLVQ